MARVVQLAGVTKRFGRLEEVVKGLDLDIEEGEFLTLLGPSGCGKTTTLRLISGFEVPDGGEIRISDRVVNGVPPFHRPVNTVFQTYALFPHMTVADNVKYGLTLKRLPRREVRERVSAMLDRVGLGDKARAYPHQLSGGQMQRVALARALVNEPRVLLLDEPLSALDAKLRRAMQLELKHMQESLGITFLYVTHDQEEAMTMSDRVAVMNAGRIEQLGRPSELFETPRTLFTAEFLGIGNLLEGKVAEVGAGRCRIEFAGGQSLVAEGPSASAVQPATNAVVAIRPQKVRLHVSEADRPASANQFRGRLTDVIYVGTTVRLHFALPGGAALQAENLPENLPFDYRALAPGDEMVLALPPNQLLVYPR